MPASGVGSRVRALTEVFFHPTLVVVMPVSGVGSRVRALTDVLFLTSRHLLVR